MKSRFYELDAQCMGSSSGTSRGLFTKLNQLKVARTIQAAWSKKSRAAHFYFELHDVFPRSRRRNCHWIFSIASALMDVHNPRNKRSIKVAKYFMFCKQLVCKVNNFGWRTVQKKMCNRRTIVTTPENQRGSFVHKLDSHEFFSDHRVQLKCFTFSKIFIFMLYWRKNFVIYFRKD